MPRTRKDSLAACRIRRGLLWRSGSWRSGSSADTRRSRANSSDGTTISACSHGCFRLACHRSAAVAGKEKLMDRRARPNKDKAEAKRPPAPKSPNDLAGKVRDLEKRLAEAEEQQTATAEILRVISRFRTDTQPVF